MNELVKLVKEKTGLADDQAKQAVDTVISFLKEKLPAPIGSQIDGLLAGMTADSSKAVGDAAKGIIDLLGKK